MGPGRAPELPRWIASSREVSGTLPGFLRCGEMPEWPKGHDWKSCVPKGTEGSNPSLSSVLPLTDERERARPTADLRPVGQKIAPVDGEDLRGTQRFRRGDQRGIGQVHRAVVVHDHQAESAGQRGLAEPPHPKARPSMKARRARAPRVCGPRFTRAAL